MTEIESIALLNLLSFTIYFLVPYVACQLIKDDFDCLVEDTYNTMLESVDTGYSLNPQDNNNDEPDCILHKNIQLAKKAQDMQSNGQEEPADTVCMSQILHDASLMIYTFLARWELQPPRLVQVSVPIPVPIPVMASKPRKQHISFHRMCWYTCCSHPCSDLLPALTCSDLL